jgi:hypothetical protein
MLFYVLLIPYDDNLARASDDAGVGLLLRSKIRGVQLLLYKNTYKQFGDSATTQ